MKPEPNPNERPIFCTDEHLEYLDRLRASGVTNMFGAGRYVRKEFGLSEQGAKAVLVYWMKSFPERHPAEK